MKLSVNLEVWPIRGQFTISRSSVNEVKLVVVTIKDGKFLGRGECRPYARYGETPQTVIAQIETIRSEIKKGITREALSQLLPAGAARNAIDCALWDLDCKRQGKTIWELIGKRPPKPKPTAFTLSVACLLYTSPSPRDQRGSRMPSSA